MALRDRPPTANITFDAAGGTQAAIDAFAAKTPSRRLATVADVIHAVFFLLDNPAVNSHDVEIDGRMRLV